MRQEVILTLAKYESMWNVPLRLFKEVLYWNKSEPAVTVQVHLDLYRAGPKARELEIQKPD